MLPEWKLQQKIHDTAVDDLFCSWNCFFWILPGHIGFGPRPRPILPHSWWLGIRLWGHCRTLPYRFQHMDSVPWTCTCGRVEHYFVFHSHSSQWASSDRLPHQSNHSVIQDTVWNLFCHHSAWNHLNKDKNVFHFQVMVIYLSVIFNIQMIFSSFGVYCTYLWNLQSSLEVQIMPPFHLEFFLKNNMYVSRSLELFMPFDHTSPFPIIYIMEINGTR